MKKQITTLAATTVLVLLLAGCSGTKTKSDEAHSDSPKMEISCYFQSWANSAADVPYDKIDQIYYAFLRPTPTGGFEPLHNPQVLKELVLRSHEAGVKVSIAVGGAQAQVAPAYEAIAADPARRAVFIKNLMDFVNEYDLDGVDIDWEYPVAGVSDQNCGLLMEELYAELHPKGKLLSIAVPGDSKEPKYPDSIFPLIDYLNVMSYDRGRPNHSTLEYARNSIAYWTGRGCPANKIMLGVPFYSRSTTADPLSYAQLLDMGADPDADSFTDPQGNNHGYNGRLTLDAKVKLARESGIAGIMIWQIKQDTNGERSLLKALHASINEEPPASSQATP